MSESRELAAISKARQALVDVRTIPELKRIRDEGYAAVELIKRVRSDSYDLKADAMEIVLRCDRRIGESLAAMDRVGHRPQKGSEVVPFSKHLAELNMSKPEASRYQAEASVHEADFERWLSDSRSAQKDLTADELIKMGRAAKQDKTLAEIEEDPVRQRKAIHEKTAAALSQLIRGLDTLSLYDEHAVPLRAVHKTLEANKPPK